MEAKTENTEASESDSGMREGLEGVRHHRVIDYDKERAWLLWPSGEKASRIINRLFPMPGNFEYGTYRKAPGVEFLRRARLMQELDFEGRRKKREAFINQYLNEDRSFRKEKLPQLNARRDALKTQLQYDGERLRSGPLQEIRRLLMSWYWEAKKQCDPEPSEDEPSEASRIRHRSTGLWDEISHGAPTTWLRDDSSWIDGLLEYGPKDLGQAQQTRLLDVMEDRDRILLQSLSLSDKLKHCEAAIQIALDERGAPPRGEGKAWKGDPMSQVLTTKRTLLEYAKEHYENEEDKTLKDVYAHVVEMTEEIPVPLKYSSFNSFKTTYYKFHQGG